MKAGDQSVYFSYDHPLAVEQTSIWRSWMKAVFQPMNQKIEDIIQNNAQLISGNQMPKVFQTVIAHVEAYKGVIAAWRDSDESRPYYGSLVRNTVVGLNYPDKIVDCVQDTYLLLKRRQQDLRRRYIEYPWQAEEVDAVPSCN